MISLASVSARSGGGFRRAASVLVDASFTWERGALAVVGAPADGTTALLDVISGRIEARRGRVVVSGGASVVHVGAMPSLPEALRVDEVSLLSAALRGEPARSPAERLEVLGVEHLASRRVRSLSRAEARAVQLALALTSRADVLLVEEPLAWMDAPAVARALDALRARASSSCVVVTTASVRDAVRLGDAVFVLTQGVLAPAPPGYVHVGSEGARLTIVLASEGDGPDPRITAFVASLRASKAVAVAESEPYAGGQGGAPGRAVAVAVSGPELLALAGAVARAAADTRAPVEVVEPSVVPLDALRTALASARAAMTAPSGPGRAAPPPSPSPEGAP